MKDKISGNVIRRLPRYLRQLDLLMRAGEEKVSSGELGRQMGLTASQIRQDLNCFGGFGQQGYGYNVAQLREGIAAALGLARPLTAVVIGAGNLGRALLANFRFEECGVQVTAAFDVDERRVGGSIGGTPVLHAAGLEDYLLSHPTDVAVLTLPQQAAEEAAALAARCGVGGLWNFTGLDLTLPDPAPQIEHVHFSDSLLTLGYYLRTAAEEQE